ncbi:hypothetical protein JR316_0010793 [Psilocybe cubensis]|uniref:Gylcosyl hydrolase 115 C-terminal domain-containing protein n=2 Tax=Psilocybe cubensis TaxID=181762 RepID=A0A8H7XVM0_PSICU|nr:hypothetical protein JR316_0010793 [Psilocybe cubensis]KAH9476877.1 hypothetical protein JR316_0010793 [Psilocybe cubensis]
MARARFTYLLGTLALLCGVYAIGQDTCVTFQSSSNTFAIVDNKKASPILISSDDWPGVQIAAANFQADIERVTSVKPSLTNFTIPSTPNNAVNSSLPGDAPAPKPPAGASPIIIGTLGKSSLIDQIVKSAKLDVSSIDGKWESFMTRVVSNPLPGVASAYVIIGADKRGTIFALYDHSEQFGVSPWYWWADVPTTTQASIFVANSGCSHGTPSVKYRGIFLNDEQPALQNWAAEKFTNGTGAPFTGSPFNHVFYTKLYELILRLKGNYLWPAMWGSAFGIDDPQNQPLADYYGVVMGTSHQEPMMRSTPNEFNVFGKGPWDYTINADNINAFWMAGAQRARPFESVYTIGMRGFGDLPLSENTNIALLESVIANQTQILQQVYNETDVSGIPQIWALYKEVEGYYDDGMRVPDYVTLLWSDDNWGNVRRFPTISERNRTGGAGVYYHVDYVGDPRDYKWITSSQIEKIHQQMSLAIQRQADRLWILNVGDLKPYERETEFFLSYGWNATRWTPANVQSFVSQWATREFDLSQQDTVTVANIVANLTRFNARRKPELLNSTTYSLINYREADNVLADWAALEAASTKIYNSLSKTMQPAFFQLVHHPVIASSNVAKMLITAGQNNMRASQARLSTNQLADTVEQLFEHDFDIETQYHTILDGKWDQYVLFWQSFWLSVNNIINLNDTDLGYFYWQQPMTNSMPMISRVQSKKNALAGVMRIVPEGTLGAWPGDNPNQCAQGYSCPPPSVTLDNFSPIADRYFDVGAGGPTPFTFTATSNVTWLKLTPAKGSISPSAPEQRVIASVTDWSKLSAGSNSAQITFTATATGQAPLVVPVMFFAVKNTPPSGFKGFVEGTGVVSIEAAHASRKTTVQGISWTELPGLGKTLSAVTPMPLGDVNFTAGAGPTLEYDFVNFNNNAAGDNVTVIVYLSPSLNSNTDQQPLAYSLQIDSQAPVKVVPIGPEVPGGLPNGWDGNDGWVANSIITTPTKFSGVRPGAHTLKISMMEPAVVIQKIVIDAGGLQPSYLGPPESIQV